MREPTREWWPEIWRCLQPLEGRKSWAMGNGGLKFGGVCNRPAVATACYGGNGGLKFGGVCNLQTKEFWQYPGNGGLKFGGVCNQMLVCDNNMGGMVA